MKVVTGETMQLMDRRTIDEFGVPGLTLMENAGRGCVDAIVAQFGSSQRRKAVIVAGKGNNGGDGYVIARLLKERGWEAHTFVVARREDITGDAAANLARLDDAFVTFCPLAGGLTPYAAELRGAAVIVDALFGVGLKSAVAGPYAEAVGLMNESGRPVVAVDIPSGVHAGSGKTMGAAVMAHMTVTFAAAKLGHILYPGADYTGTLIIADIGVPPKVLDTADGFEFLDAEAVRPLLPRRKRSAHKGGFGHCLIVAGSAGKTGAAAMAANSAVRTGAGLVTLAAPESLNHILEVKTTEAMTLPLPDNGAGYLPESAFAAILEASEGKASLAIGPGLSWRPDTARLARRLAEEAPLPMVIDADGLNALSEEVQLLLRRKTAQMALTPHPGEMARLAGCTVADVEADRIGVARAFAVKYGVCLVLKGARTVIAAPDGETAINGSGNPGMASGGMGDVLTGMLAALLGQGYAPFDACKLAVFVHGHAADMVAAEKGEIGMSALDVQEKLPYAFKELTNF